MKFRILTPDDFLEVFAMWQGAELYCESEEREKEVFINTIERNPDTCIAAVNDEGMIIGTVLAGYDGHTTTLYRVAIDKAYRNQGIGSHMLAEIEKILKKKGIKKVFLKVHCFNLRVLDFYKHNNYKEMDYARVYYKEIV